ncbi:MAG: formylglycine-generating enzyme family protein [Anaerolineae bacterium]
MESNANMNDVENLITFGQMALEQGWYSKAYEYFEQALALDVSNREAMKGLARVNEILSRKVAAAVKPIQYESVQPPPKVAAANRAMYGLAAIVVLAVVAILAWLVYTMLIEPRREVAVAATAAATHTETPKPTPTLKPLPTPTQKESTPTPVVLAETIFGEAVQRQIYSDYVEARRSNVGDKDVYEEIAQQWGTTVDVVKAIAVEGFKKNWGTLPPVPPTPTPEMSYEEAHYLMAVTDIKDCFLKAVDLVWVDAANAEVSANLCLDQAQGLSPPPRLADIHSELLDCSWYFYGATIHYIVAGETSSSMDKLAALEYGNQQLELARDCMGRVYDAGNKLYGYVEATPTPIPLAPTATLQSPTATLVPSTPPPKVEVPMIAIPAGQFIMGSDHGVERPPHLVFVGAFEIDKFEVTNEQFERFVWETGYVTDAERAGDTSWRYYAEKQKGCKGEGQYPVVKVSWNDAKAFCEWAGKRLPTEAEWEKAARGTDARTYPWGNQWEDKGGNQCGGGEMGTISCCGRTCPGGSFPSKASPYCVMDMAGNVAEWTSDWFQPYPGYPGGDPEAQYFGEKYRVLRGGGWFSGKEQMRTTARSASSVTAASDDIGFRCAR